MKEKIKNEVRIIQALENTHEVQTEFQIGVTRCYQGKNSNNGVETKYKCKGIELYLETCQRNMKHHEIIKLDPWTEERFAVLNGNEQHHIRGIMYIH